MIKLSSSEIKSIIYGIMLGDGCLSRTNVDSGNYRLHFAHSSKQEEYALWKKRYIDSISHVSTHVYNYTNPNSKYSSIRITTNALRFFSKIRKIFYNKDGVKILNKKVLDRLAPLGLSIWYMDDGSLQRRGNSVRCSLHTQSFSLEENITIQKWFKEKYNITTRIQKEIKTKTNSVYYRQEFSSENCKKLLEIVRPYVERAPGMNYKL